MTNPTPYTKACLMKKNELHKFFILQVNFVTNLTFFIIPHYMMGGGYFSVTFKRNGSCIRRDSWFLIFYNTLTTFHIFESHIMLLVLLHRIQSN